MGDDCRFKHVYKCKRNAFRPYNENKFIIEKDEI